MATNNYATDGEIGAFPSTQWSQVGRVAGADLQSREALGVIVQRYLPALRGYLRSACKLRCEQAEELLQGFIADKVVAQNLIARATGEGGRFRNLLMVSLRNYVRSDQRRRRADRLDDQPVDQLAAASDPAHAFTVLWAREMVSEAVRRMKVECESAGRVDVWHIFDLRVVRPALENATPVGYSQLVEQLALRSPLQCCNLLTTGKRTFARILRAVAAEHAIAGENPDEEIADLRRAVAAGSSKSNGRNPYARS